MNLNDILDIMVPVRIEPEPLQDITVGTRFLSKGSNEVEYRVSDITGETVTLETNFYNRKGFVKIKKERLAHCIAKIISDR